MANTMRVKIFVIVWTALLCWSSFSFIPAQPPIPRRVALWPCWYTQHHVAMNIMGNRKMKNSGFLRSSAHLLFLFCGVILSQSAGNIRTGPWWFGSVSTLPRPDDSDAPGSHLRGLPPRAAEIIEIHHEIHTHGYTNIQTENATVKQALTNRNSNR